MLGASSSASFASSPCSLMVEAHSRVHSLVHHFSGVIYEVLALCYLPIDKDRENNKLTVRRMEGVFVHMNFNFNRNEGLLLLFVDRILLTKYID